MKKQETLNYFHQSLSFSLFLGVFVHIHAVCMKTDSLGVPCKEGLTLGGGAGMVAGVAGGGRDMVGPARVGSSPVRHSTWGPWALIPLPLFLSLACP